MSLCEKHGYHRDEPFREPRLAAGLYGVYVLSLMLLHWCIKKLWNSLP